MSDDTAPKVLFIGGYGRSGSTLLDRVLGSTDGFFSAGELRSLFTGRVRIVNLGLTLVAIVG